MGRSVKLTFAALVLLSAVLLVAVPARGDLKDPFKDPPAGWKVKKSSILSKEEAAEIGEKLGGSIEEVRQTILSVEGKTLQVNIVRCPTTRDAWAIYKAILKMKGNPVYCLYFGDTVVEFVCEDFGLVKRAHYDLGFRAREAVYRVSFEIAAIDEADYMESNNLYNLFLRLRWRPDNEAVKSEIATLAKRFQFGTTVRLRTGRGSGEAKPTYTLTPSPVESWVLTGGDVTEYAFDSLSHRAGVPYVSVTGSVSCRAFEDTPTDRNPGRQLLAATPYWPVDDPEIAKLAHKIAGSRKTDDEKVAAILEWLLPGKNIDFSGPTGSRHGVKKVLRQGFGRCWDFSDLFVTLCRASGVPCRQVAGWIHRQTGHVWAEVLLARKGWRQVDPSTGITCDTDYVPWFTTEDGEMSIVYVSMPRVELVELPRERARSTYHPPLGPYLIRGSSCQKGVELPR